MGALIAIAILLVIVVVAYPMIRELDGDSSAKTFNKPSLYDLEGYLQLGIGFIVVLMLLAALGIFGYDFYWYVRIATSVVVLILIYQLLRYRLALSLLLFGFVATLILFNPFERVTMSRGDWIVVDIAVALILPGFAYIFITRQKAREKRLQVHKKS